MMDEPTLTKVPLVLVPGLLCDASLWQPQTTGLQECADCWVADITQCDSLPAMVEHVLAQSPFERFSLAGLSMGGYIAAAATLRAPQRVQRLALLNSRAHESDTAAARIKREAHIHSARTAAFEQLVEQLLPVLLGPGSARIPEIVHQVKDMSSRLGAAVFIRQQLANTFRPDIGSQLMEIRCPTWVIGGEQDAIAPPASQQALAARIPQASLLMLRDCGHLSTLERPQEVNDILRRWLLSTPQHQP